MVIHLTIEIILDVMEYGIVCLLQARLLSGFQRQWNPRQHHPLVVFTSHHSGVRTLKSSIGSAWKMREMREYGERFCKSGLEVVIVQNPATWLHEIVRLYSYFSTWETEIGHIAMEEAVP
ncbi:uncharacterized protein [Symphalangus syndactylus]|uniref:uncharacterized protein isoform X1 n=1 Tax=Symphalangus syndactylus TaxID=9590 RepID=UPI002441CF0B|nr:uncharacterized protein LOC129457527 [Symphalangus syndactylus]